MGPSSMPASGAGASRLLPTSSFSGLQLESPSSSRELIHEYKIVLLGDYKVGKTSLFGKITSKESRPTPSALPDGTQVAYRTVEVDGIYLRGHLWDQGCLRTTVDVKPADADAALLVYHTANRLSYDNLPAWVQHIRESTASPQLPIVIVGNGTGFTRWMQKKVTAEEASAFAGT
ncbi:P-loop containing nucleoside triphosphate hydrolase protein [Gloeopeniophorella convolvens]|nr:P-loop containing nucleoside triphosphate hydrolase protein [Gloeopeniophorella convolvens]